MSIAQNFRLAEASEFENKNSHLGKQYWLERGNLIIKSVTDYSSKDTTPKTHDQLTRDFAASKLETYKCVKTFPALFML